MNILNQEVASIKTQIQTIKKYIETIEDEELEEELRKTIKLLEGEIQVRLEKLDL